ncbi:MAG TPA: CPCC family cysteine-rich protein [Waddliaceae bacterium]
MNKEEEKGYPCPCCGFLTLSENTHETFEICPVCNWEDDDVQFNNPDFRGGANEASLNEARENYKKFGAASKKYIKEVRNPLPDEIP